MYNRNSYFYVLYRRFCTTIDFKFIAQAVNMSIIAQWALVFEVQNIYSIHNSHVGRQ